MKKFANVLILFALIATPLFFAACEAADESKLIYSSAKEVFDAGTKDARDSSATYQQVVLLLTEYFDGRTSYTFEIIKNDGSVAASGTIDGFMKDNKETTAFTNDNGNVHLTYDCKVYLKFDNQNSPVNLSDKVKKDAPHSGTLECDIGSWNDALSFPDDTYGKFFDYTETH